jgi:hypothetical protein
MSILLNLFRDDEPDMLRAVADSIGASRAKSVDELSAEVGISADRALYFLQRHPEYFTRVAEGSAWRLNGFGGDGDALQRVRARINGKVRRQARVKGVLTIVLGVCLLVAAGAGVLQIALLGSIA